MIAVILTVHVLIVLGLIALVLLQRSEGGALGIGGGGGGGLMSGRGAANMLTRLTSISAALFFATSLGLAMLGGTGETGQDVVEDLTGTPSAINQDGTIDAESLLRSVGTGLDTPTLNEGNEGTLVEEGEVPGTFIAPSLEELEAGDPLSSIGTDEAISDDDASDDPRDDESDDVTDIANDEEIPGDPQ